MRDSLIIGNMLEFFAVLADNTDYQLDMCIFMFCGVALYWAFKAVCRATHANFKLLCGLILSLVVILVVCVKVVTPASKWMVGQVTKAKQASIKSRREEGVCTA